MAYNYNQSILVGRLTKDPELKLVRDDCYRLQFFLAVQRNYKKADESVDVDFIPVVFFGKQALNASNLLVKGSPVLVWGRIQVRSFDTKEKTKKWITEVKADNFQLLDRKNQLPVADSEPISVA